MEYSREIERILRRKKIEVGNRVRVVRGKEVFEGLLMPRIELGDRSTLILKLDNGYNIGIRIDGRTRIEKIGKGKKPGKIPSIEPKEKRKERISFVATGGTIGTHVDYLTGGVYMCRKPEEILATVPELEEIVSIKRTLRPFTLASEDITPKEWQKLARIVARELNSDVVGVIITHGTDTLHFTSAALSFMLRNLNKPVALVGAQRSPDRGSFDGRMNLLCAAHFVKSGIAEVCVIMHSSIDDEYCFALRGTKVRKMHTSRRDAFKPINDLPLASIWPDGKIQILNEDFRERNEDRVVVDAKFEDRVALVKAYPGSNPEMIDWFLEKGYKGIVIEGTGLGHVPTSTLRKEDSWIPHIKRAVEKGMVIAITSQCLYGRVHPYVYRNLRVLSSTGAIFCEDMLPEVAYIKLGWVLAHTRNEERIREMMLRNYAGEISKRIV